MKKKHLLLILLMALIMPFAANAEQALPYEYGFEASLANAGWTLSNASNSGITNDATAVHSGSYGFLFPYSDEGAYLMSPILTGGDRGIVLSFYYMVYSSSYVDHFKVGYTTDATVTNPSEFTYGAQVTTGTTSWQEYTTTLPAGTVRMAIFYDDGNYDDGYYLFLDDFSFEAISDCDKPTSLTVSNIETNQVQVDWFPGEGTFNVEYKTAEANTWTTHQSGYSGGGLILDHLTPATTYDVRVQKICDKESLSGWKTASFTTSCPTSFSIPYSYGFEDEGGFDCWTVIDTPGRTHVADGSFSTSMSAHTGDYFFVFTYYDYPNTDPQYMTLISPQLTGTTNGVHVEFYYVVDPNYPETFRVGYSTTDNDLSSFNWTNTIANVTPSDFELFRANYPAGTKYIAVQHLSDDQDYLILDDFSFTEAPSCVEPSDLQVASITTTGAALSWIKGGEETAWDVYVTDNISDVPDDTTTPTYENVTSNSNYPISGLTSGTTYYVYVRSACDASTNSDWTMPTSFNTECETISLPYQYDFEDDVLSVCWNTMTNSSWNLFYIDDSNPQHGNNHFVMAARYASTYGGLQYVVLPEVDASYSLNEYQVTFYAKLYNGSGRTLTVGVMTDPDDASTFVQVGEAITPTSEYVQYTIMLNTYSGSGQYIAIKHDGSQDGYVYIDNLAVTELPACIPPTNVAISGGANAVVTWEGTSASYQVAYSTDGTVTPDDYIIDTEVTTTSFDLSSYVTPGDNYVWVRSNCDKDHSVWVDAYYDLGYCVPNPTSHDSNGITGVSFGTGSYVVTNGDGSASLPASSPYYGDYTSMIGAVNAGVESTIAITTGTGSYPYTFVIWVDLDKDYTFEDEEVLYVGKASAGNGTLNATITVPAAQDLDDYRMRIFGADSYFSNFYNNGDIDWSKPHDPCYSGSWCHAHDYTLRVLEAPSCFMPGNLAVDNATLTGHEATLTWTGSADNYNIDYRTAAGNDGSMLDEHFDGLTSGIPAGWDNTEGTTTSASSKWSYYNSGHDAAPCLRFNSFGNSNGNTNFLKTPSMDFPAGKTMQLTFWWKNPTGGDFSVYISTDGGTTKKPLKEGMTGQSTWKQEILDLTDYIEATDVTIHFMGTSNYGNGDAFIYLDDVVIGEEILAGAWQHATSDVNSITLTNLSPETLYEVKVQSDCGSAGTSEWTDIFTFTTDVACFVPANFEYNTLKSTSVVLEWDRTGGSSAWQISLNGDEDNPVPVGLSNLQYYTDTHAVFLLVGLVEETDYSVRIRANCTASSEGYSAWSSPITFKTLEACALPTDVTVSNVLDESAHIEWTGDSPSFTVKYRTAATIDPILTEDFEDETHYNNNWTVVNYSTANADRIGRQASAAHDGSYGFRFSSWSNDDTYEEHLINKNELTGITDGVIEFYYKKSNTSTESFKVGYSSTDNETTSFTFGENHEATQEWQLFHETIPAGTKFVSIQYTTTACNYYIFVDDIVIGNLVGAGSWETETVTLAMADLSGLTGGKKYEALVYPSCDPTLESDPVYFTTYDKAYDDEEWGNGETTLDDNIILIQDVIIPDGVVAYANTITFESGARLIIEDGGQLYHNEDVTATLQKDIEAYTAKDSDGWYLISTPVDDINVSDVFSGTYDLYMYDEPTAYWWSHSGTLHPFTKLNMDNGYLYASDTDETLEFTGDMMGTEVKDISLDLDYTATQSDAVRGFNLMGNPLTRNLRAGDMKIGGVELSTYMTAENGTALTTHNISEDPIKPGRGFFVQATAADQELVFNPSSAKSETNNGYIKIVVANENSFDNAFINIANGNTLRKMNIANTMEVYVINEDEDYAAARVEELEGKIPVNFKAVADGEYNITINANNVEAHSMYLRDNFSGETIDLLESPSYTFKATANDDEARFTLLFDFNNFTGIDENLTSDLFVYQYGNEIIVNGEGTLEVFDVMGRMVLNTKVNGVQKVNVPANAVYIFKLMGETVKTQKIVVR